MVCWSANHKPVNMNIITYQILLNHGVHHHHSVVRVATARIAVNRHFGKLARKITLLRPCNIVGIVMVCLLKFLSLHFVDTY